MDLEIKENGQIFRNGVELKQFNHSKGYKLIWDDGKNKKVHRLVAEKYIPNPLRMCCVNHKDGNKINNNVENLEWINTRKNLEHARLNGFHEKKQNGIPDLTDCEVRYIRSTCKTTSNCYRLAKELNRDYKTIERVCKHQSYKDIE